MAHPLNEHRQATLDGRASLRALETQRDIARAAANSILARQSAATAPSSPEETTALAAAEQAADALGLRIAASRKLLTNLEAAEADAIATAEAEAAALAKNPSGRVPAPRVDVQAPEKFASFGEQLVAIQRAARPGAERDNRLLASSGLNTGVPSEGGFLVQQDFSSMIWERMYNVGELIKRAFRVPITGNGIKIPAVDESSRADGSRYGGVQVFWTEEGGLKTASKPAFRQMDLKLKKVAGVVYTSDELLEDAGALEAFIQRILPIELQFAVENAFVNGTGAGQPLGYMNSGAVISATRSASNTVTYEDVLAMWSRMWAPSRATAIWLVSQMVEPQLYTMSLAVGTGGAPVYLPAGGASVAPYATLFGRPVIASEYTSALGTAGDIQLVDMSQYVYIDKGGVKADSSMHVRFLYDEMTFRFVYRVDGQPAWNTAITPKNGGDSLSPFIILAA